VWREKFLVRPAGNQTGDLSLMRRVWYHKTTASALFAQLAKCIQQLYTEYHRMNECQ
jgi:hypothetical protein